MMVLGILLWLTVVLYQFCVERYFIYPQKGCFLLGMEKGALRSR